MNALFIAHFVFIIPPYMTTFDLVSKPLHRIVLLASLTETGDGLHPHEGASRELPCVIAGIEPDRIGGKRRVGSHGGGVRELERKLARADVLLSEAKKDLSKCLAEVVSMTILGSCLI